MLLALTGARNTFYVISPSPFAFVATRVYPPSHVARILDRRDVDGLPPLHAL